jgi:hypothetical protein
MKFSRCRYWRCPECQALYEKKDLADFLRRRREGEEVSPQGKYRCSRCGAISRAADVYAGEYDVPPEEWGRLPGEAEIADGEASPADKEKVTAEPKKARAQRIRRERPEPVEWAILDEEADEEDAEETERRRRHLARWRALSKVNVGLAIHYFGMLAFLLGQAAGWGGIFVLLVTLITMGARAEGDPAPVVPLGASFCLCLCSWILTALSSVADLVASAFCLSVPHPSARGFLIASMAVRATAVPSGLVLLILDSPGLAVLASCFLAVVGWVLWVAFFCGLTDVMKHPKLGEEAVAVTFSALRVVGSWFALAASLLMCLIFLLLMLRAGIFLCSCMSPLSFAALIAGIIKYLMATGKFESIWSVLLFPTGIPTVMRYLDLIGTTRMIILRRS